MVNFEFSTIKYKFEALNDFETPYFLGSAFRGILGKRLKKTVCIKPFENCLSCEFKKTCPYTVIFETETILNQPSRYVMRPPFEKRNLKEKDNLELEITLLGETTNYWEFITASFSSVLNIGKERYLKLKDVYFYHPFEKKYYPIKGFIPKFEAKDFLKENPNGDTINIRLFPTSIKIQKNFLKFSDFNKELFLKAVISRVSKVAYTYGEKAGKIFIDKDSFEITKKELRPSPLKRWSNRKKTLMTIPAFEGEIQIKGDLSSIYPYLKMVELINIGKSVSFGLGKLKLL
ncbi:MAG: CRISPR system precrRNA processing endoribonuclease RAMP protein Cas6 [Aquificae bacterium]|nr:CRISPR system precrRNA processing endoribonuclease RAMP protein Cas6 [Aquificota bacterium]